MSGQRTVTINCLPRLTQTCRYQDGIICSAVPNCGTDRMAEARRLFLAPADSPAVFVQGAAVERRKDCTIPEEGIKEKVLEWTVKEQPQDSARTLR